MIATKSIGTVTLTRDSTHKHAVEGHCEDPSCDSTFVAFGEEAAEAMARRHLVLAHPDQPTPTKEQP